MAVDKGLVSKASLTAIGDAIREKNKTTTQYKPSEMAQAIKDIEGDKLVVTTGDKYTLKVINPSNATITSSLTGKAINNSDGTVSVGITDSSTYNPNTGYDPGIILRSFNKNTGVYTVTGTAASPTSIVDSHGFARMYMSMEGASAFPTLYSSNAFSGASVGLPEATGKIFIAGLKSSSEYNINMGNSVTAFFDPIVTTEYHGLVSYRASEDASLQYLSLPSCSVDSFDFQMSHRNGNSVQIQYMDLGSVLSIKRIYTDKAVLNIVLRKTDGVVTPPTPNTVSYSITNLYVPSSLISSYKTSNWKNITTNIVVLEGSKYEDPYAFLNEISSS